MTAAPLLRTAVSAGDGLTAGRLSILIFHRVQPQPDPLFPHEMDARRFDGLMGSVAKGFQVLTVGEAHALWQQQRLPARALAITFDDGYADNAEVAMPILQRHGLRATFFVATGFLDGGRMWNDTVIEALRRSPVGTIDLSWLGLSQMPLSNAQQRRAAIDAVLPCIKYRTLAEREAALANLMAACGQVSLPGNLMMRSEQVRQLHLAGSEIGGHTVHHPILTEINDAEALVEITAGRDRLQQITGGVVDVFAYPNGRPGRDYDARHLRMVRQAGFRCAVSTATGPVCAGDDDFQWRRHTPWQNSSWRWHLSLLRTRYRRSRDAVVECVA